MSFRAERRRSNLTDQRHLETGLWVTRRPRLSTGFSLVELIAVLAIVSLLAATATLVVRLPLAKSRQQYVLSQVATLDAMGRSRSVRGTEVELTFDLRDQTIGLTGADGLVGQAIVVGKAASLRRVLGAKRTSDGAFAVRYDRFGTSCSYAIELGRQGNQSRWMLVLGMTGQVYENLDETKVREIISAERAYVDRGGRGPRAFGYALDRHPRQRIAAFASSEAGSTQADRG